VYHTVIHVNIKFKVYRVYLDELLEKLFYKLTCAEANFNFSSNFVSVKSVNGEKPVQGDSESPCPPSMPKPYTFNKH